MKKADVVAHIAQRAGIPLQEVELLFESGQFRTLSKNTYIQQQGRGEAFIILIQSGCLMTYYMDEKGNKHVLQFGREMWWTGDLEGFQNHQPPGYSIRAVVESEVYLFSHDAWERTLLKVPGLERYFRILFANALIHHQKRIMRNLSVSAEQRYEAFKSYFPKLELLVPQKYIASYLGITPEFLSKLKRGVR